MSKNRYRKTVKILVGFSHAICMIWTLRRAGNINKEIVMLRVYKFDIWWMMLVEFIRSVNSLMKSEPETQRKKTAIWNGQKVWGGQIKCHGLRICSEDVDKGHKSRGERDATESEGIHTNTSISQEVMRVILV
jgi:hypothetical protein